MSYDPAIGTWVEEDPDDYVDGSNLYQFTQSNPIASTDPMGSDTFSNVSNFAAGIGDSLSMGITSWIRDKLGVDAVDYGSKSYKGGEVAEISTETIITIGGEILRRRAVQFAGDAGRYLLEKTARSDFRDAMGAIVGDGTIAHHWNPIRDSRFPLSFTWAAQGTWNMVLFPSQEAHVAAHAWLETLDTLDLVRTWSSPIRSGGNAILQHMYGNVRIIDGASGSDGGGSGNCPGVIINVLPTVTIFPSPSQNLPPWLLPPSPPAGQ